MSNELLPGLLNQQPTRCHRCGAEGDHGDSWMNCVHMAYVAGRNEGLSWHQWPANDGTGHYPPDETDVLIREKSATGVRYVVGRISKRGGVYGPSFATHWASITDHPVPSTLFAECKNPDCPVGCPDDHTLTPEYLAMIEADAHE
jgi:hypothetical protein